MKIALVRSAVHRHGGVERYVWLLARELAGRGHEVHLIARRCPELPHPSVRFHPVQVRGIFSFQKVLSFARGAQAALAREAFDVVHSCDRIFSCDIYRAGEGVHREWLEVSARHLPPWKRLPRRLDPLHAVLCRIERRLMAEGGARRVTAISKRGAEEIRRHFGLKDVPVIYNGVDPEEFAPPRAGEREAIRRRIGVPGGAWAVLYVGSGFFRKGLRHLIAGFARVEEKDSLLLVSGRGTIGPYRRLAERLGAAERVRFLGMEVPAPQLYRAADAFVFPTLYEPFGNVCLEALACGLPCVLSSMSGGAEIVTDGVDGLALREPTDPEEIARLIRRTREPGLAGAMGRAARALALRFSVGANADATEALYREVAAGKAAPRAEAR
ncbi:MAG: glycosyltransferase family 4 protein [Candidatus Tectomicrobia bacterium]|uniref:Glycosyltransferase family 4 protein n=1 Tax=Tectimicrobiota bacterium TaxID=2528274 RepID=A0A932MM68_UNCTE|nr:glycosyltransferase family 4 protein [Candidatus Tectomicrobia bacterium]